MSIILEKKVKNPLRKAELRQGGNVDYNDPKFWDSYREYFERYPAEMMESPEDVLVKKRYDYLMGQSETLAKLFLNSHINSLEAKYKRPSTKPYTKVFELQGVQVFVDMDNVKDTNYKVGSPNYRAIQHTILVMLTYIRDVLPNRKPKIVITNLAKNPHTRDYVEPKDAAGISFNKLIFIDEKYKNQPQYYVHEYAHWVADLIPTQTQQMLIDSYEKLVRFYYEKHPKYRGEEITPSAIKRISKFLHFPEYGMSNHDEFFAVLIERWKMLKNNALTYRFKSLVKDVLTRL